LSKQADGVAYKKHAKYGIFNVFHRIANVSSYKKMLFGFFSVVFKAFFFEHLFPKNCN